MHLYGCHFYVKQSQVRFCLCRYLAPEYAENGIVSVRTDVYAFGIVLIQLISGRKALDSNIENHQQSLRQWVRSSGCYYSEILQIYSISYPLKNELKLFLPFQNYVFHQKGKTVYFYFILLWFKILSCGNVGRTID